MVIVIVFGFVVMFLVGAGVIINMKGIRFFLVSTFAVLSAIPVMMLLFKTVVNIVNNPLGMSLVQNLPINFWIYLIPAGIFIAVSAVIRLIDNYRAKNDDK